jgi:hypothetical protein
MTTSNGHGQDRVLDQVEGSVAAANERGIEFVGETVYHNFSKYADPPITAPRCGSCVRLGLAADGLVRQLQVLDQAATLSAAPDRAREIHRQMAIKTAAQQPDSST